MNFGENKAIKNGLGSKPTSYVIPTWTWAKAWNL